ncbi:MAG: metal-dependent hydrolase [Betaproteobacteria bacterium]
MTDLVVRKLLVDLNTPFAARWNGNDAFRSAFFNALSMSFPVGEQFFMDSVRAGLKTLPEEKRAEFAAEVQGFVGQEATHRRVHALFNGHLERMGFSNTIAKRATARIKKQAGMDPRVHVAATAATEHFTALFADWVLRHPEALEGAQERLQTMWLWHASEESEHRSTAFDIYQAMGGGHAWRLRVFRYVSVVFIVDVLRQTVRNLWHDGALFHPSTWRSGAKLLMAKDGMFRGNVGMWRDYLREDFHPDQHDASRSQAWLRDNTRHFVPVGSPAAA